MSSIFKNLNVQNVLKCILQRLPVLGGVKVTIVAYTAVVLSPSIILYFDALCWHNFGDNDKFMWFGEIRNYARIVGDNFTQNI